MKVLVTGASGFIGKNVLTAAPPEWDVVATYRRDESFPGFLRDHGLSKVTALRVDLGDAAAVAALDARYKAFDACIYLAANGDPAWSTKEPGEDLRSNAVALLNLVSHATFGHLVFFSSGAVYDGLKGPVNPRTPVNPTLPYAISKWAAERYVAHAQHAGRIRTATIVRFFGAYGPHEPARKIYGRLVKQFAVDRSPAFTIRGDGRNLIDAMHVDDTVRAIRLILDKGTESRTVDLCSGTPLTLAELVTTAAKRFGLEPKIELTGEVPEYIEFRSDDRTMETAYGFKPQIALGDGLERFRAWMAEKH
jgi:nucleoside-diphosphate-sugar epimerase